MLRKQQQHHTACSANKELQNFQVWVHHTWNIQATNVGCFCLIEVYEAKRSKGMILNFLKA
jgi:hypothetical protein